MPINNQLKLLGLNNSEITVYLFLLENGLSTPPIVSQGTKISRSNCYNILAELKNKGLIAEQRHGKRKAYLANDPESLVRDLEKKRNVAISLLPDLRGLYTIQKNKPKIRFFDGIEQIKELYLLSLNSQQILGFASTNKLMSLMPDFYNYYNNEIKKRGIVFKDILTFSSKTKGAPEMKKAIGGLYSAGFLSANYGDFPTDMLIWNDNVALITLEEPIFGTLLTNKTMTNTFKVIHEVIWPITSK